MYTVCYKQYISYAYKWIDKQKTFETAEKAETFVNSFDNNTTFKAFKVDGTIVTESVEDFNVIVKDYYVVTEPQTIIPVEVFQTGLNAVKTDVTTMLPTALTVGLAIMGLLFAIHKGIDFFKGLANQGAFKRPNFL